MGGGCCCLPSNPGRDIETDIMEEATRRWFPLDSSPPHLGQQVRLSQEILRCAASLLMTC